MTTQIGAKGWFRVAVMIAFAATIITACWQIFSLFMLYDDEGYVLHALNEFAEHGSLYDRVYSQYGPLFSLLAGGAASVFGFEWTHDLGRMVTVLAWLTTAGFCGLLTTRLSRSRWAGLLAFIATSAHLGQMAHEPMHPGNLMAPLLAVGAWASVGFLLSERPRAFLVSIALLAAVCALIKINVGIFVAIAGFTWWAFATTSDNRIMRGVRVLGWGLPLFVPAILMRGHLDEYWGQIYMLLALMGTALVAGLVRREAKSVSRDGRNLASAILSALVLVGVVLGLTLATGSTLHGVLHGLIVGPLQHSDIYSFAPNWRWGTVPLSVASIVSFLMLYFRAQRRGASPRSLIWCAAIIQIGLLVALVIWSFFIPSKIVAGTMTVLVGSLGWLLVGGFDTSSKPQHRARVWIALLLSWQFLHAYPVAGTQLTWGTFLWIPLLVAAASESARILTRAAADHIRTSRAIKTGYAVLCIALIALPLRRAGSYYRHAEPLNLPGAKLLRVPPGVGSAIRINAANAALNADLLYSLPGSFSFNLWTDLPTPNSTNVTHWVTLLSNEQQQRIVDQLTRAERTAWIVQPYFGEAWIESPLLADRPLIRYFKSNYRRELQVDGIELWLPKGHSKVLINFAQYFLAPPNGNSDSIAPPLVELNLALATGIEIDRIEVHTFHGDRIHHDPVHDWHGGNTIAALQPLPTNMSVSPTHDFREVNWPFDSPGLFTLRLSPRAPLPNVPIKFWWLRIFDTDGNEVAEARFDTQPVTPLDSLKPAAALPETTLPPAAQAANGP
ncbi:MAG: hypothetical protein SynsKO_23960 [Synoicihabitans sp.]